MTLLSRSAQTSTTPRVSRHLPASQPAWAQRFARPLAEHRACPFWFWNGDLEPAELLRQIRQMHDRGVGGFIIHSRLGCTVPYLSETWFDRCRLAVEEAERLGMKVWLYDEDNWPSGYAGGRVMIADPTLAAKHLAVERHCFDTPGPVTIQLDAPGEVVAAVAMPIQSVTEKCPHPLTASHPIHPPTKVWSDRAFYDHTFADAPGTVLEIRNGAIRWDVPTDGGQRWCVMVFRQRQTDFCPAYCTSGYVDLLDPRTTRTFIGLTHEQYRQRLGRHFGKTILGFFTDEPGFYNNFLDRNPATLPWTGRLLEEFRSRRGYELVPWLAGLWEETGPRAGQVRSDYWRTVGELLEQNFTGQLAGWCADHGVQLTGHLLIEESLLAMQRFAANPFSVLRPLQVTGVDRIDEQDQKISEKLASSIAHLNGRPRVLSETFALIGWKLAPPYMKRIVDFQFVRGVNWLVPHAFYYSIDDWRRMECPPSVFFQNPWWEHSKPLWDHVARLSAILSQGRHVAPVALYYPIEHGWDTVLPGSPGPTQGVYPAPYFPFRTPWGPHPVEQTDAALNRIAFALTGGQWDFDLVDHELLASAKPHDGALQIGPESFRAVVVPPVRAIASSALRAMLNFAEAGGLVIFSGQLPQRVLDDAAPTEWETICQSLAGGEPRRHEDHEGSTKEINTDGRYSVPPSQRVVAHGKGTVALVPVGETGILQMLGGCIRPDVRIVPMMATSQRVLRETQHAMFRETRLPAVGESLTYLRRRIDDRDGGADVYFLVNESDRAFDATLELAGGPAVERWETHMDRRETLAAQPGAEAGTVRVTVRFEPWQAHVLVLRGASPTSKPTPASKPLWSREVTGWVLEISDKRHDGPLCSWHELGLPAYSGTGRYHARFTLDADAIAGARLQLDLGMVLETARITINGVAMPAVAFPPYTADITPHILAGENELVVEVANTLLNELERTERPSGLLGPVRLVASREG